MGDDDFGGANLLVNATYFGVVCVPTSFLIFTLQFTHNDGWLTRRKLVFLAIEPALTFVIVWTNDLHHFFHSRFQLNTSGDFTLLVRDRGPWFWVNVIYSYALILAAVWMLGRAYWQAEKPYRSQHLMILLASLFPWAASILTEAGYSPFWS